MSRIKTSCAKCLFAVRDNNGIQTGCQLGRVEIYRERGVAELDGSSYLIQGLCQACRANDQFSMTASALRKSLEISASVIINGMEKDYWYAVKQVLRQKLMPSKVIIIVGPGKVDVEKYTEYLKYFSDKESNLLIKKYHLKSAPFWECVNDTVDRFDIQYYTILDGDSDLDPDYLRKIDVKVNDNLEPLVAVFSDGEYRNTFSSVLHHMLGGNAKDKSLKQKVIELPEQLKAKGNIWNESTL